MKFFKNSFYLKISSVFLVLVLTLGGVFAYLGVTSSLMFVEETAQKVNRDLAADMAVHFQPFLNESIDSESIQEKIQYLNGINPQIDIYLLGGDGMIKGYFLGEQQDAQLSMEFVDTEPLDAFMKGEALPIEGQDPLNEGVYKPFSVADISIMGEANCYLYVILTGQQIDQTAALVKNSYILRNTFIGLGLILTVTLLLGLLLFRLLTNRLKHVSETVKSFEQGQLEKRVHVTTTDEIGELGTIFNQMADTLVANMDEIKRVDKLRRELVANVSHDLRSPLASIQGYLETILQKEKTISNEDRAKYYEVVLRNTQKLSSLVGELFELSKLDAKDVQPEMEPVSMAELARDVVQKFQPIAEQKNILLKAEKDAELPDLVYADIALMERAISNLIDNALKHTPEGGEVSIISSKNIDHVSVTISDTGKGISAENLDRVFDRFYQEETSRTGNHGAGLGLSIAQKIIELHGATLSVKSALNRGTSFSFSLSSATI